MSAPQQPPQQPGQQPWSGQPSSPPPGYGAPQQQYGQGPGQPAYPNQGYQNQPYPNQPYPNQGYPNQVGQAYGVPAQQPGGGPTGELVLNLQKPFGAMGMISPVVRIDGYPAQCGWGRNAFPVPAGGHQVEIAQSYLWTYGRATMPVVIEPGRPSEVYYAGPMFTFGVGGSIGTGPQKRKGMGVFIGLMVFVVVVVLIGVLAAALGSP